MVQITANATNSPVNVPVIIHPNVQSTQRIKLHAGAAVHHHTVSGYALAGRQRGQPGRSRARHTQRGAVQIPVTFTITTAVSNLVLSPPTLYFNFQIGGGAPQEQTIAVNSTRADALAFTAAINSATGASWLGICSTSGTTPGFFNVGLDTQNLNEETYTTTIVVQADGAGNNPQSVPVTLTVARQFPSRPARIRSTSQGSLSARPRRSRSS